MAYRNDLEALLARHVALEAEVAERIRARDEVARLLAEARALEEAERQLADLAAGGPARRRRHRTLMVTAMTALTLVAGSVGFRLAQPRRDRLEEAITQMTVFTDEMCSCVDAACAEKVSDAMTKWGSEMAKEAQPPLRLDDAITKRFTEIGQRLGTCMSRAMTVPRAPAITE
jgi:hypothetical protein